MNEDSLLECITFLRGVGSCATEDSESRLSGMVLKKSDVAFLEHPMQPITALANSPDGA